MMPLVVTVMMKKQLKNISSKNNAPERNSRTIDFDGLKVGRLHYEESVAGGATGRKGGEIKNNIDKDFEKKKSKFSGSSDNSGERYGWAVDGNGKRWYYTQKKLKTKRGKDVRNELLSNSHRAKADETDWALKIDGHGGTRERPDWTSDREVGLKRSRSEEFGLANLSRTGKSKKGDLKRMYKATSTLELLVDDDPLSRSKRLQLLLEELKTERRLLDTKRQELLKQVKRLHSKTNKQKAQNRETWRARYLEEKKKTPELEDECTKFRNELERLHRELLSKLKNDFEGGFANGRNAQPSDKLSLKIMIARLIQEIEDLKRQVESTKIRLGAETKLRTYAEKDVKALREELMNKKIQVTLTKKEEQSFLGPTLRNGHFISAV
ncbi:uncharacterized protein LOC143240674 [Tachypleus tridentatus]|uniref:uncharacterized protein LOC143240674 n=1 Tax=Tachypleus tridentatus TaxID=6853 RepID=UPI003FD3FAC4